MSDGADGRVDMTTGRVTPRLLSLAWPLVAGNLLQTAYNLADLFWVGQLQGARPDVAAVSLMFPTAWLFVSVAMGLTAAANAVVSQHVGAGEERAAENAVAQSVLLALAVAGGLAAFGYAVRRPLVAVIGAEGAVFDAALAYIEVVFLAIPFTFLFFVFRAVLRAAGDTRTAMWLVVISAGVNILIDPFFILEWGLGLRAQGAAIATFLSRGLAAAVGVYILLDGGWGIRLRAGDLRPDPPVLRRLVGVGYPATFDGLARSLSAVAFAALVARFGAVATAAYGIGIRLMSVSWTVSGAVGQAAATGVGQNLGARQPDRAAEVTWKATAAAMGILAAAGGLIYAVPAPAVGLFIDDPAVIDAGVVLLRIIAPFWAFFGGLMVIQGGFRGAGSTRAAFVLSLLSRWVLRMPAAWLLAYAPLLQPVDVNGLWWGMAFSSAASFLIGVAWFRQGGWTDAVVEGEDDEADPDTDGRSPEDLGEGDAVVED